MMSTVNAMPGGTDLPLQVVVVGREATCGNILPAVPVVPLVVVLSVEHEVMVAVVVSTLGETGYPQLSVESFVAVKLNCPRDVIIPETL
jgi:hypothetical protein